MAQQYPVDREVAELGRADVATCRDVPQYAELLQYAAGKMGWDLAEFDVYRVRMPYPIMYSTERVFSST